MSEEKDVMLAVPGGVDAIKLLIEVGASVTLKDYMIYQSGKQYRILHFNENSNLIHNDEKNYEEVGKAIKSFAKLTGGKLG